MYLPQQWASLCIQIRWHRTKLMRWPGGGELHLAADICTSLSLLVLSASLLAPRSSHFWWCIHKKPTFSIRSFSLKWLWHLPSKLFFTCSTCTSKLKPWRWAQTYMHVLYYALPSLRGVYYRQACSKSWCIKGRHVARHCIQSWELRPSIYSDCQVCYKWHYIVNYGRLPTWDNPVQSYWDKAALIINGLRRELHICLTCKVERLHIMGYRYY